MNKLSITTNTFEIIFPRQVHLPLPPTVIIRSVIGKILHNSFCTFPGGQCQSCLLNSRWGYGQYFEPTGKGKGMSLPSSFVLRSDRNMGDNVFSFIIEILVLNENPEIRIDWLSVLQAAGKDGIFKERIPYEIVKSQVEVEIISSGSLNFRHEVIHKLRLETLSPFRTQSDSRIERNPNYLTFLKACYRRWLEFFGTDEEVGFFPLEEWSKKILCKEALVWEEWPYYSSRQKTPLRLGGASGTLILNGPFDKREIDLLSFGEKINIGKNTAFGLGRFRLGGV